MKKKLAIVAALGLMLTSFTACGNQENATTAATDTTAAGVEKTVEAGEKVQTDLEFVRLAASDAGGDYYTIGVPFCTLWEAYLDGVSCTLLPGGGTANVKSVSSGEAEAGWTQSGTVVQASRGEGAFEEAITNVQMLFAVHPGTLHIATLAGSNITSIEQVEGCKIGLGPTGNTGNSLFLSVLEEEYGITEESIQNAGGTVNYLAYSEAGDALKDGQIDVWVGLGPYPIYGIAEVALNPGISLLSVDEDKMKDYCTKHPNWTTTTIPAGTYGGFDQDYTTFATWNIIIVRDDMDENVAYAMTKAVFENLKDVEVVSSTAKNFLNLDNALSGSDSVTMHPGAVKYFQEIGLLK
ncbi:TAXI family TRAP transporter solute-binding subunit [Hominifimenecus sp. rT4P-3]|uniref:TAXI family TRAP transporter solute-binding subunit n=1 Tax=Hominifimenecus sp. rT4P-3 TaxID=3242979 RepID=UPI003DA404EE